MNKAYLLLGSNMGNSQELLSNAEKYISEFVGHITLVSSVYYTEAWGNIDQPHFLNKVLLIETNLDAIQIMLQLLTIEERMGRIRTIKYAPRIIDIDILFFNNEIIRNAGLIIPHLEIQNRRFALVPMNEIAPDLIHPLLNKPISRLLLDCNDNLDVKKF